MPGLELAEVILAVIIGTLAAIVYSLRVLILLERRVAGMEMNIQKMTGKVLKEEMVSKLQEPLCKQGDVPWLGMYGGGELTTLGGRNLIHTFTSSLYIIVERDERL